MGRLDLPDPYRDEDSVDAAPPAEPPVRAGDGKGGTDPAAVGLNVTDRQVGCFIDNIIVGDDCWEWRGYHDQDGYAKTAWKDTITQKIVSSPAHRVVYRLFKGDIISGLSLEHLCRNRGCVKPSHLDPVTHHVNVLRGQEATKTHCVNGHEFSASNTYWYRTHRYCRTCKRINSTASWRRRSAVKA